MTEAEICQAERILGLTSGKGLPAAFVEAHGKMKFACDRAGVAFGLREMILIALKLDILPGKTVPALQAAKAS